MREQGIFRVSQLFLQSTHLDGETNFVVCWLHSLSKSFLEKSVKCSQLFKGPQLIFSYRQPLIMSANCKHRLKLSILKSHQRTLLCGPAIMRTEARCLLQWAVLVFCQHSAHFIIAGFSLVSQAVNEQHKFSSQCQQDICIVGRNELTMSASGDSRVGYASLLHCHVRYSTIFLFQAEGYSSAAGPIRGTGKKVARNRA